MIIERTLYAGRQPYRLVCEPCLRQAPNGDRIIVFQSGGGKEPANDNVIMLIRSQDDGKTWTEPEQIFATKGKGTFCPEVSADEEKLTVFLCEVEEDRHFATLKAFRSYSYDSGYTWTPREPFGSFHECCNVRQQTVRSDGAWLYPFCYTTPVEEGFTPDLPEAIRMRPDHDVWKRFYLGNRYRCGVLISHDKGETFERYEVPCDREQHFLWEPSLVELSDGRLVMLIRHQYDGWLWRSESLDGGKTWSKAERTDIPDPAVKMRLFKLADGRIVLFCHPNSAVRYPLEMWVSSDDMATWHKKVNLQHLSPVREGTTVSQYHYPDGYVDEVGRKIAIAVDLNRRELVMIEIPFEALD